jgi:hypothetical protein
MQHNSTIHTTGGNALVEIDEINPGCHEASLAGHAV